MLNHLKQWILDGVGKRSNRRRSNLPRFRGQIEPLESRTVLSATIGVVAVDVMAVDFDAHTVTVIAVVESRPFVPERLALGAFNQLGEAPWENLPSHGYFGDPWRPVALDWRTDVRPPLALSGGGLAQGSGLDGGTPEFSETGLAGANGSTDNTPQFAHADPSADPGAATGAINKPVPPSGALHEPVVFENRLPQNVAGPVASYFSSLSTLSSMSEPASSTTRLSLNAFDAAFGEYSPNSLLLAADVDSPHGSNLNGEVDNELESEDKKLEGVSDSGDSLVDEELAASLDALQRERAAIDAVLAQLHDLTLPAEKHASDQAETKDSRNSAIARESGANYLAADQPQAAQPVSDQVEGGMVLLEPSGDANSSAYDLTAAYFRGIVGSDVVPLGVEASVGMYQAIDVGANDLRPTNRESLPIAQPAATIRPSVSAENAPAKKSDQPS